MCEYDASNRVKRARARIAEERTVVDIDSSRSDSASVVDSGASNHALNHGPNVPVK